jgi:hypothetical protein
MSSSAPAFWKDRFKASGIHLSISLVLALLAGALVFGVWYPYPYREISGGRNLFLLLVSVDVVLGPLITLAIFDRRKPRKELVRDLTIVGLIQLAALGYGLWTVFVARPVHLVFEVDRFRVVHAIDVADDPRRKASPDIVAMPLFGPTVLSLRPFKDEKERADAMFEDVAGSPTAFRPDLWQPYGAGVDQVRQRARPVAELKARFATRGAEIDAAVASTNRAATGLVYLPVMGRDKFWTAFLDAGTLELVGFMPLDPF